MRLPPRGIAQNAIHAPPTRRSHAASPSRSPKTPPGATIAAILKHLSTFDKVDVQVILGLLSIYVLLGLLFACLFMLHGALVGRFFSTGPHDLGSCVYLSFVTLATVGFGELTPTPGLPRALSIAEAIIGELYLVTVVALAVGRLGRHSKD